MNLNADLGEGGKEDRAVLAHVDSASVACGVHAGSASLMLETGSLCRSMGVEVGAHPGYGDRAGFGRVELGLPVAEIEALVASQVAALAALAPIAYVKPHGALYHRCEQDRDAADALARIAIRHGAGLIGQPGGEIVAAARRAAIPAYREGFADRRLLSDGSLAPRTGPGALLDPSQAAEQAVRLAQTGLYDTICIHGDTPNVGAVAAQVGAAVRAAGIATGALARSR